MPPHDQTTFLIWLRQKFRDGEGWKPAIPVEANLKRLSEMPRFPIRVLLLLFFVLGLVFLLVVFWKLGNPLAEVQDPRLGSRYNQQPLTALAARGGENHVWLGSQGGGIKVYDAACHLFDRDVTRASTGNGLLSDFVQDVKFGPNHLAAIVVTDGPTGVSGVQMACVESTPRLWKNPCVGLTTFLRLMTQTPVQL